MIRSILFDRISFLIIALTLFVFSIPSKINAQHLRNTGQVTIDLDGLKAPANLWRIEDILNVKLTNNVTIDLNIKYMINIVDRRLYFKM
jgi:hypothetical protein